MDNEQKPVESLQSDVSVPLHPAANQPPSPPPSAAPDVPPPQPPPPTTPPVPNGTTAKPQTKVQWCPNCRAAVSIPAAGNTCPACSTQLVPLPPDFAG